MAASTAWVAHALAQRKEWALEMAGLKEHARSLTAVLSTGWKQRLALACAILHEPPVIFLDEPTSGVDPLSRRGFWELIYAMAERGVTVFVTTHYMEEAEYCDRLGLIYRGRMVALGTPLELKSEQMHEQILDLRCPLAQRVMAVVKQLPAVRGVALFGDGLHVVTQDTAGAIVQIRSRLEELDIPITRLEQILPSIEDVFVSLIEQIDSELQLAQDGAA